MKKQILSITSFVILFSGHAAFAGKTYLNCRFKTGVTIEISSKTNGGTPDGCVKRPQLKSPVCGYSFESSQSLDLLASGKASPNANAMIVWPESSESQKKLTLALADFTPSYYKKGLQVPDAATYAATIKMSVTEEALRGTCTASSVQD